MSSHTKAPWLARPEESGNYEVKDYKGRWVARVHFRKGPADGEAKANADLIASAPDLLAAAEACIDNEWEFESVELLRAAIKKARGAA